MRAEGNADPSFRAQELLGPLFLSAGGRPAQGPFGDEVAFARGGLTSPGWPLFTLPAGPDAIRFPPRQPSAGSDKLCKFQLVVYYLCEG